jgi:hypothetical protein
LRAALEDVKSVAAADRRPPLDHQLDSNTDAALVPDGLGIGSGSDVVVRDGVSNGCSEAGAPAAH